MIRRVMLLSLDGADDAQLDLLRQRMGDAPAHIEGVVASTVHDALAVNDGEWTLVWETAFADAAAVERYRDHPYHTGPIREGFAGIGLRVATAFFDDQA